MKRLAATVLGLALVAGAGGAWTLSRDDEPEQAFDAAVAAYDGPLDAPGRFGSAGRALDCVHDDAVVGSRFRGEVYRDGATAKDPERAVETAYSEGLFLSVPEVDLGTAASDGDRRLLTYEHDGVVLMALLLREGPGAEGTGGEGWYVEAHARCDYAEFPPEVANAGFTTYELWTGKDGEKVPVARVHSTRFGDDCAPGLHVIVLGKGDRGPARLYGEDLAQELDGFATGPYVAAQELPADARATGWEREGRRLWLSKDGASVYVGSPRSVSAWPRFEPFCG